MITRININIDGTSFKRFESFSLSQSFEEHHVMDIILDLNDVNKVFGIDSSTGSVNLGKLTQDWSGKKISVTLSQGETDLEGNLSVSKEQTFDALITEIQFQMRDYVDNSVTIIAMSPTIVLESGENTYAFSDMLLSEIVSKVINVEGWLAAISPTNNPMIPYVTQYRESFYHFVQRLAKKYGEWFFYDGSKFIFGKSEAKKEAAIKLEYGSNLVDMSYETKLIPLRNQTVSYDYYSNERYMYTSSGTEVNTKNFAQTALQKSLEIYNFKNIDLSYQNYSEKDVMIDEVKNHLRLSSEKLAVLKGNCTSLGLYPGSTVTINDDIQVNGRSIRTENYGDFLIIKTNHFLDSNGHYQNSFEAIPDNPDFAPTSYPYVTAVKAESQTAIVIDTNDPMQMGRIKVNFPWHNPGDKTTPWIRVANLMAGDKQGFYFVPEVDEIVFVDFEFGNPDMPFVRGSMYHGSVIPGDGLFQSQNNIKGIITRGGNHIIIDDSNGKEEIRIYNKDNKNEVILSLNGEPHINFKSEGKITIEGKEIALKAQKITMNADQDWEVKTQQGSISAQSSLKMEGTSVSLEGKSKAAVKGSGQLELEGGATASLKGGIVMIN